MPPEDMTLMYAAAKGISRSTPEALSLALFMGTIKNPAITKRGRGTKIKRGRKLYSKATIPAITETGTVNNEMKNINEIYVSG
jgi:hypothetical protein